MIFTGVADFYSRSYSRVALHSLLTECGVPIIHTSSNLFAHCATVLPKDAGCSPHRRVLQIALTCYETNSVTSHGLITKLFEV